MMPIRRVVVLLLLLQVVTIVFLWTLDALNQVSEGTFALFLAADMIGFAMISYLYRHEKEMEMPSKAWLVVGGVLIVIFMFSSLVLH
jgi:hypothetical protein